MADQATESVRERAQEIYDRTIAEAESSGAPEWIEFGGGRVAIAVEPRGRARRFYADEFGCDFVAVRARRVYMRVSFQAIRDLARDMASDMAEHPDEYFAGQVAYTWRCEGWVWEYCKRGDDRAVAMWECSPVSGVEGS